MTEAVSPPTLRSHLDTTIATRRPSGTPKDDPADTEAVANRPATEAGGGT
jgi:hypothetical protein